MSRQHGPVQGLSKSSSASRAARGSHFSRITIAILAIVSALLVAPSVSYAQDNLIWNPSGTGTGSDGAGTWNNNSSPKLWYDQTTSSQTAFPGTGAYANVTIGDGGTLTGSTDQITIGATVQVGNITFGAMSGVDYNIVDTTGGSNPLVLNNVDTNVLNPVTTITNNTGVTHITELSANIAAPSAFTLNILGAGNTSYGGAVGMSTGGDTGAGTLVFGTAGSSTAYTGTSYLLASNNVAGTTINSGTVAITNSGSLGSGPVTLAGGTLSIFGGSIGVNVATSQTNPSTNPPNGSPAINTLSSGLSAGVYSVAQWNNLLVYRNSALSAPNHTAGDAMIGNVNGTAPAGYNTPPGSTVTPVAALTDNSGLLTTAQITGWQGFNGYSTGSATTSGTAQLISSGLTASGMTTAQVSIADIPYSSYSVYVYLYDNGNASGATNASVGISGGATYFFNITSEQAQSNSTTTTLMQIASTATTSATATSNGTTKEGMYADFTNQTASSFTVTDTAPSGAGATGTPWIAGIQIVPNIILSQLVTVSNSSTISLGAYSGQPTFAGGLTVDGSAKLTLSNPSPNATTNLGVLNVPGTTTFAGSGGILSPGASATFTLAGITDNGFGFTTSGAGTVQFTTDSSTTASGPVSIGTTGQLEMNAYAVGAGSATGTGPLTITSGGEIFGNGTVANSSVTINSGGTVSGPVGTPTNTVTVNSPTVADNGLITTGSGTLHLTGAATVGSGGAITTGTGTISIAGMTTVNGGGNLNIGLNGTSGETLTLSGGATLAGGTSTYTLRGATTSGLVNASSLNVTGSSTVDAFYVSAQLPTALGQASAYDLLNYTGGLLATGGGYNSPLTFSGAGQGGSITFGYGTPAPAGDVVVPTSYLYQLSNIQAAPGVYEIQLAVVNPFNLTSYNGAAGTPGTVFGSPASWTVTLNSIYAGYVSQANAQTSGGTGAANGYGPLLTTDGAGNLLYGAILAGNNSGTYTGNASAALQMAWRNRTLQETSTAEGGSPTAPPLSTVYAALISNVLNLTGMSTASGEPVQTDPFVLQMNYDSVLLGNEASAARGGDIFLAWLNPAGAGGSGQWQNANAGNFGPTGVDVGTLGTNFQGPFSTYLADEEALDPTDFPGDPQAAKLTNSELALLMGAYGVDTSNHDVWGVVNHNSEFAVVPEPSSIALAAFALLGGLWAIRRRRSPAVV